MLDFFQKNEKFSKVDASRCLTKKTCHCKSLARLTSKKGQLKTGFPEETKKTNNENEGELSA